MYVEMTDGDNQEDLEEANYYHRLADFEELINEYGAEMVLRDMHPDVKGYLYKIMFPFLRKVA